MGSESSSGYFSSKSTPPRKRRFSESSDDMPPLPPQKVSASFELKLSNSKARRCLFPSRVTSPNFIQHHKNLLRKNVVKKSVRWNFNFSDDRPLLETEAENLKNVTNRPDNLQSNAWTTTTKGPSFYRTRSRVKKLEKTSPVKKSTRKKEKPTPSKLQRIDSFFSPKRNLRKTPSPEKAGKVKIDLGKLKKTKKQILK